MTRTEMFDYIRKNKLQDEVQKMFGKVESKNSSKKTTVTKTASITTGSKCAADYTKLKNKYDSLVEAVAVMLYSIDNEETAHDLQDAINNIRVSLAKD